MATGEHSFLFVPSAISLLYYLYVDGQIVGEYSNDIIDDPNRYATIIKRIFMVYGHKPEAKPSFEINVWCEDQDTFFMLCDYVDQLDNDPNILVIDMPR